MQRAEVVELKTEPEVLDDVFDFILRQATGKSVLNVGAAGGVEGYLPANREIWLHERLGRVARELVGVDIDSDSIEYAARHGVEIGWADCESMELGRRFDVIVMSDVIEHLNAPARAVEVLVRHLSPGGKLLVTTPNPTQYGLVLRALLRGRPSVYYDHMSCFLPEHVQAMCDRFGFRLTSVYFFGHVDRRTPRTVMRSRLRRLVGTLSPRLHDSFLAVVEASPGAASSPAPG